MAARVAARYVIRRLSFGGKALSEEKKAAENVYIKRKKNVRRKMIDVSRKYGPRLKHYMHYCINHPEELSKLSKLKAHISEVKGILMDNIEKVLDRGELLDDKTENLQLQADDSFQRQGRHLRRQMWL